MRLVQISLLPELLQHGLHTMTKEPPPTHERRQTSPDNPFRMYQPRTFHLQLAHKDCPPRPTSKTPHPSFPRPSRRRFPPIDQKAQQIAEAAAHLARRHATTSGAAVALRQTHEAEQFFRTHETQEGSSAASASTLALTSASCSAVGAPTSATSAEATSARAAGLVGVASASPARTVTRANETFMFVYCVGW